MNIKSSNHFCTHHLSVGFLVGLPTFARALSAPCALRTRVLGLESADRALHLHSLALWRILRFGNCTIAAVPPSHFIVPRVPLALHVVDRTDGFSTRPLSDPSWYLPRVSSQRRGLPSSCVVHIIFVCSTWAVSVPLALSLRVYADFQPRFGATKTPVDHHRPAGQ